MKKTYTVESTFNDMRLDRWIRNVLGNIPQGLIEKNLRSGKIKLNKKKLKVPQKLKLMIKLIYLILSLRRQFYKKK
jgi:23S rRNA pseudouridine955/2504/2580 synthase